MITNSERIKELRNQSGLSSQALSIKLGWSKYSLDKFESGKQTPSKDQIKQLAQYFGVSENYVRAETNDPTRQDSWMDMAYDFEEGKESSTATASPSKTKLTKQNEPETDEAYNPNMFSALLNSPMAREIIREVVLEELNKLKK